MILHEAAKIKDIIATQKPGDQADAEFRVYGSEGTKQRDHTVDRNGQSSEKRQT